MKFRSIVLSIIFSLILAVNVWACKDTSLYQRALSAWNDRKADKAIEMCDQVIQKNQNCSNAYALRGEIYREKNLIDLAIEDFNRALHLNPKLQMALSGRAMAYKLSSRYEEAIEDYTLAIHLKPDPFLFYCRGQVFRSKGNYFDAWIDLTLAHSFEPDNRRYKMIFRDMQRAGIEEGKKIVKDNDARGLIHKAYRSYREQRYADAISIWESIIKKNTNIADVKKTLWEITQFFKEDNMLSNAEYFYVLAKIIADQFMNDDIRYVSGVYEKYSEYLFELGRYHDSDDIKRQLEMAKKRLITQKTVVPLHVRENIRAILSDKLHDVNIAELPVFCTPTPLQPGTKVFHSYSTSLTIPDNGFYYYVWIDIIPPHTGVMWAHPVHIFLVPASKGKEGFVIDKGSLDSKLISRRLKVGGPPSIPSIGFKVSYSYPTSGLEYLITNYDFLLGKAKK